MSDPELIIDPGHGGKDGGGGTNKHWNEDDFVLKISLYQYNRYKELGIPVAITRKTDKYLGSDERTRIVRNSGAKYCHSNHVNAGGGDGAEVIHSIYSDGKMAQAIADEIKAAGQNIRRVFTRKYPGRTDLDYYFMIRETGSVETNIIEYGFADSPQDDVEQLLNNWKDYAEAVVKGFCKHIGHKYTAPGKKPSKGKNEKPKDKPKPKPKPKKGANLTVDGKWGSKSTRALQKALGTVDDGIISGQYHNDATDALYGGVEFGGGGSLVIEVLQRKIGAKADGLLGPNTVRKLQSYLGTTVDGVISRPSSMVVKEMQRRLNKGNF